LIRCKDRESEWRGGFSRAFQNIFLEGPVYTTSGDLFVVDIPYGRILRIDANKRVNMEVEWDGEPNGLAVDPNGKIAIADYKQVCLSSNHVTNTKLTPHRASSLSIVLLEKSMGA
jgi:sugar lactone lactonase YvrE